MTFKCYECRTLMVKEDDPCLCAPDRYRAVTENNAWSNVVGPKPVNNSGPWRYAWEAQEYADELNAE